MSNEKIIQSVKSVGIVGDGDDVDLIVAFEGVFQISFANEEAENITTLGQAFEVICSKLPNTPSLQGKCMTAMAYYRLNKVLKGNGKIKLTNRVSLPDGKSPRSFQQYLEERTGLSLGFLTTESVWVTFLFWFQLVSWIIAPIVLTGVHVYIGGITIALVSHSFWRIADNADQRVWIFDGTLDDLSQQASALNFAELVSLGGAWKKSDVWKTMTAIIHEFTEFPTEEMKPEMKFI